MKVIIIKYKYNDIFVNILQIRTLLNVFSRTNGREGDLTKRKMIVMDDNVLLHGIACNISRYVIYQIADYIQ